MSKKRLQSVGAQIWVHRHGICPVAIECLAGVMGCGVTDVATLGIQNEHDVGVRGADVRADSLQLGFGADGSEIGDLGFERTDQIVSGIDNADAELLDAVCLVAQRLWKLGDVRVESNTEHRITRRPGGAKFAGEPHLRGDLVFDGDCTRWAHIGGLGYLDPQLFAGVLLQDVEEAITANLEHLRCDLDTGAGRGTDIKIHGNIHGSDLSSALIYGMQTRHRLLLLRGKKRNKNIYITTLGEKVV